MSGMLQIRQTKHTRSKGPSLEDNGTEDSLGIVDKLSFVEADDKDQHRTSSSRKEYMQIFKSLDIKKLSCLLDMREDSMETILSFLEVRNSVLCCIFQ